MSNQFKMAHSVGGYPKNMSLFTTPLTDVATYHTEYVEYSSKFPLEDRRLLFMLEGVRNQMVDLHGMKLHLKGKIVFENGDSLPTIPREVVWNENPIEGETDELKAKEAARVASQELLIKADVFTANNLFYSLFKDGYMTLQNNKYFLNDIAYRGIIETVMHNLFDPEDGIIMNQFYRPSNSGPRPWSASTWPGNRATTDLGVFFSAYTEGSNEIEMCGKLLFPMCEQKKLLLSHVDVKIELLKHEPEFYLRHPHGTQKYKFAVTDAKLIVPLVTLPSDVEIGMNEVLQTTPAIYTYNDKRLTVHSISKDSHQFESTNTWNGDVPCKLTVLMVPSINYHGTLATDPFEFKHNKVSEVMFTVDNQPVGGKGMHLKIGSDEGSSSIIDAYCAVTDNFPEMKLARVQWFVQYPVFYFNINSNYTEDVFPLIKKGLTKFTIKFDDKLEEDTVLLMLAEFPGALEIDGTRNVST